MCNPQYITPKSPIESFILDISRASQGSKKTDHIYDHENVCLNAWAPPLLSPCYSLLDTIHIVVELLLLHAEPYYPLA